MRGIITLFSLVLLFNTAGAQYSRYIIQFKDKKGTAHSLASPATYLSAKAIERRTKQHISFDSTDLPVSVVYLDSLRKVPNVTILNTSKWLNQVLIVTTDAAALATINSWSFVRQSAPVAVRQQTAASYLTNKFPDTEIPVTGKPAARVNGTASLDYGNNYAQVHIHRGEFLHNHGLTGKGMIMAVLDAGFRSVNTNPAFDSVRLQNRILGTWDYVKNESSVWEDDTHGANCFSIIAANKPGQIVGTAPYASFWLLRTEDAASEYPVEEQNWVAAAEFADSAGVDMISSSLGYINFDNASFNHTYAQRDGNTTIVTRGADFAAQKGILVMNSAGNDGNSGSDTKYIACPADGDSVMAVGATTTTGAIASFSSWGPSSDGRVKPNIVSVGQGTVYANTAGNAASGNGTSYSNPNIAGLIACFWQAFPELTNMQVIDAVQRSADRYNNPDNRFGYGLPDFKKAVVAQLQKQAIAATSMANCTIHLTWTSKDDTSVVYTILRRLPGEANYTSIRQVAAPSLTFSSNSYALNDTLAGAASGTADYQIMQSIGSDTSFLLTTAQQQLQTTCFPLNTIRVLSNPFDRQLNMIVNTSGSIAQMGITVSDVLGRIVYSSIQHKPLGYFSLPINTAGWLDGVYIIKLTDGNKRIFVQRILKKPY